MGAQKYQSQVYDYIFELSEGLIQQEQNYSAEWQDIIVEACTFQVDDQRDNAMFEMLFGNTVMLFLRKGMTFSD